MTGSRRCGLERSALLLGRERVGELAQIAVQYLIEPLERQLDAVIGNPPVRTLQFLQAPSRLLRLPVIVENSGVGNTLFRLLTGALQFLHELPDSCLLYTSDAADDLLC